MKRYCIIYVVLCCITVILGISGESIGKTAGNHGLARFGHKLGRIWGVCLGNTLHDH